MKLQITKDNVPMHGYTYVPNDFLNIKSYAYPSQVVEIYAPDALKYISLSDHNKFISDCKELLKKKGGKLIIGGLDLYAINAGIRDATINLGDFDHLVFKTETKSITCVNNVKLLLNNHNFTIESLYIDDSTDGEFVIRATTNPHE